MKHPLTLLGYSLHCSGLTQLSLHHQVSLREFANAQVPIKLKRSPQTLTVDRRKLETYWGLSTLHTSGALAAYLARSAGPFGGESADLPAGSRLVRAKAELLLPLHNASTAASTAASAAGGSALEPAGSAAPCPSAAPSPSCESADPTAGCSPAALPTEHEDTVEGDCGSGSLPHASPCMGGKVGIGKFR
eukprot:1142473-Pelagomonas_calceolata.AAC.9